MRVVLPEPAMPAAAGTGASTAQLTWGHGGKQRMLGVMGVIGVAEVAARKHGAKPGTLHPKAQAQHGGWVG